MNSSRPAHEGAADRSSKAKVVLDGLRSEAQKLGVLVDRVLSTPSVDPRHVRELERLASRFMRLFSEFPSALDGRPTGATSRSEDEFMNASSMTHGVTINRTPEGKTRVVIEIDAEAATNMDLSDDQVALSEAWNHLAQAIADEKQARVEAKPEVFGSEASEGGPTVADAPGSGAWWSR